MMIFLILAILISFNPNLENKYISYDYYEGIEWAKELNKPILLFFTGQTCENPLHANALIEDDKVINLAISENYIAIILYVDDKTKLPITKEVVRDGKTVILRTKGNEWAHIEISKFKNNIQPLMVIINSKEEIKKQPLIGKVSREDLIYYLNN